MVHASGYGIFDGLVPSDDFWASEDFEKLLIIAVVLMINGLFVSNMIYTSRMWEA
jgi:hypothetical protein